MKSSPSRITRSREITSIAPIDLHFHGAFEIDLMTADEAHLDLLSKKLWDAGLGGFVATTLTADFSSVKRAVENLGKWIRRGKFPGAIPLGIHLEGPYLSPKARGAHPENSIRAFSMSEVLELWNLSQKTLKILTIAPEILSMADRKHLTQWAKKNRVVLSAGHSQASFEVAAQAFADGFSAVTHAFNAMAFHHRDPGILGAALAAAPKDASELYLEVIPDGIHLHPATVDWLIQSCPKGTCFVSDCTPAAGLMAGKVTSFGPLQVQFKDRASRLADGSLAGGGKPLPETYLNWLSNRADPGAELKRSLPFLTEIPLRALRLSQAEERAFRKNRQVRWKTAPFSVKPI
ncbi:MAG: hypothetical protein JNL01_12005 [Bdellovibrionales bacterium]|nr:hypothetical protein [Bdellovibrionales bacterium]